MAAWYLVLAVSLCLIFLGLTTHWSLIAVGAVLPFVPVLQMLRARLRSRRASPDRD